MNLEEFRDEFRADVLVRASADANFEHSAFVDVAIDHLADAGEVIDFEPCYYRGRTKRSVWLDGYAFDRTDSSLKVFVASPHLDEPSPTLIQADADSLFARLRSFLEDGLSGALDGILDANSPARAFADELRGARDIARFRAYLLTDALLSSRKKDWPEASLRGIPVEFHIWDISRFFRAYTSKSGLDDVVVDFRSAGLPSGAPCIDASLAGAAFRSFLCVLSGTALADIYDAHGSRLLEGNVRAFLSARGKVNKAIRNTAVNSADMFFAYNNGIAATASEVELAASAEGTFLVSARDLQIVNGGQTTATLSAARRGESGAMLDGVFVPMKLTVVDSEHAVEVVPLISRSANSQNKVSEADFFSNHEFHRRMEKISRRIWAPAKPGLQHETHWFYERARGQYLNETVGMTAAEVRRFKEANPKDQLITKTDLAKSENSWNGKPQRVSRGAQSNFLDFAQEITAKWGADKSVFNESYFRQAVARLILFRKTERLVLNQSWYSGGYRANIVTYSIARLSSELSSMQGASLDFNSIWANQDVSDALERQIASVGETVYRTITRPGTGVENVTQWCKRDACWLEVRAARIELLPEFVLELRDPELVEGERREARILQRIDSGIEAQAAVVDLGSPYWTALAIWAASRRLIGPEDTRLLTLASDLGQRVPTDWQSQKLLLLKSRLEIEGFSPQT